MLKLRSYFPYSVENREEEIKLLTCLHFTFVPNINVISLNVNEVYENCLYYNKMRRAKHFFFYSDFISVFTFIVNIIRPI